MSTCLFYVLHTLWGLGKTLNIGSSCNFRAITYGSNCFNTQVEGLHDGGGRCSTLKWA